MSGPRETRESVRQQYLEEMRARVLRAAGLATQLVSALEEAHGAKSLGSMREAIKRADGESALLESMLAALKQDAQRIAR